jgi:hypothetical protein
MPSLGTAGSRGIVERGSGRGETREDVVTPVSSPSLMALVAECWQQGEQVVIIWEFALVCSVEEFAKLCGARAFFGCLAAL